MEAQWVAERRGLARFGTEQPPYSILDRGIENGVLPVCERCGMGTLVWSPLAMGMLTARHRKGQETDSRRTAFKHMTDERRLDAVVPPGTGVGRLGVYHRTPAVQQARLRRRLPDERPAA